MAQVGAASGVGRTVDGGSATTLYVIDGTAQLFRAYFAIRGLTNAEGLPTNAVYGFTAMLRKLIQDEHPTHLAVAFDPPGEVFRHGQFAEYKANRPATPEDLVVQAPYARTTCEVLGVTVVERPGFEADDVIATYCRLAVAAGFRVVVVASDKDLLQLVDEDVSVLNPSRNVRLDPEGVVEAFGVPPKLVRDVLGLMGDSVDNIPGVPGVGEKTAIALVSLYGGIEEILVRAAGFVRAYDTRDTALAAIDALLDATQHETGELAHALSKARVELGELVALEKQPEFALRLVRAREALAEAIEDPALQGPSAGRARTQRLRSLRSELKGLEPGSQRRVWYAIHEHADQARLSKRLATLEAEVPGVPAPEALILRPTDTAKAHELFRFLGFRQLTAEFSGAAVAGTEVTPAATVADHQVLVDPRELTEQVARWRTAGRVSVELHSPGLDPRHAPLWGIAVGAAPGEISYVPLDQRDGDAGPGPVGARETREALARMLADVAITKMSSDIKSAWHILERHSLPVSSWALDTGVAAFLLQPGRGGYDLESLAREYLDEQLEAAVALDPVAVVARRAELILRVGHRLESLLREQQLVEVYERIDGPLLPLLGRMESTGIRVDPGKLEELSGEIREAMVRTRTEIHRLAGGEFNVDSPKQLREVLFQKLGLPAGRKTAKGREASTDAETLEGLAAEHPIAREILEYREAAKLQSTYVDTLPRLIDPATGRVHTSFNPMGAATGRLSSSDPNLQNIPKRSALGRRIREAFVPDPGWVFLASDYSQIELRVLAHLTGDPGLAEAFRSGEDIHRYTASQIFSVFPEQVSGEMRQRAKAVNFGILYGMSESRLAREQGMSRADAKRFVEAYFARYPSVRDYIARVRDQARREGAVRTAFGRVRQFPQLLTNPGRVAEEQALRAAVNTTIQGTAADLMKLAMLAVDDWLRRSDEPARMLLQVHDELLIEVREERVECVAQGVREAMEQVRQLAVPLAVDQKLGHNWSEAS